MADGAPHIQASPMPDGMPVADRDAPVGGQAVLEGVMMRGVSTWAVAVRKPVIEDSEAIASGGEIAVTSEPLVSWAKRHRLLRVPVIRGIVALAESLRIGFRALAISANAQVADADNEKPIGGLTWGVTVAFSLAIAVGLFFVVPVGATSLIRDQLGSPVLFWLVEGLLRTAIFIGYLAAISGMPRIREASSQYHAGRPSGAKTKIATTITTSRKLVPQRGCSLE